MEIKDLSEFKDLIEVSRKLGIKTLSIGDISVELHPDALFPKSAYQKKKEEKETEDALKQSHANSILEAERALMWSVAPASAPEIPS
jgi:hypothetical protein